MVGLVMSASSKESPDLKVFSNWRPVIRFLRRTRLKAWPLPGLTNSFSTIMQGWLSSMMFKRFLNSFVLTVPMRALRFDSDYIQSMSNPSAERGIRFANPGADGLDLGH